jgi:hypothetical protein
MSLYFFGKHSSISNPSKKNKKYIHTMGDLTATCLPRGNPQQWAATLTVPEFRDNCANVTRVGRKKGPTVLCYSTF